MKKVPTTDGAWATAPFEAQYLKLYDVTAPSTTAGIPTPPNAYFYTIGTSTTISWNAAPADSEGIVPCYKVNVTINGNTTSFVTCSTSATINGLMGQTASVTIQTVNPSDNTVTGPSSTPATIKFLDPNADEDGDGMLNVCGRYCRNESLRSDLDLAYYHNRSTESRHRFGDLEQCRGQEVPGGHGALAQRFVQPDRRAGDRQ